MEPPAGGPGRARDPGRAVRRPPGTLRVGRIAGVDVLVRSSWLLVAALIAVWAAPQAERVQPGLGPLAYVAGFAFAVLLYLSVLLHEASHALMAQHYGLPVTSITLHFLGGVTEIQGEPDTPGREFGVSVVGPLTSLGVAAAAFAVLPLVPFGLAWLAVWGLGATNLLVGVVNLVPGLPLDGGRVLRAAVWRHTGNPHLGTIVAGWGGRVTALLVLCYPVARHGLVFDQRSLGSYLVAAVMAAFLWTGASSSIVSARIRRRLPALQARGLARRALTVPHDLPLAEAVRRAREDGAGSIVVLDGAGLPTGIVSAAAVEATPEERRPWLPVSAVARTVVPDVALSADLSGEPLILAMQRVPASEYLLVEGDGAVFGVLVADDVDRAFADGA